MSTTKPSREEVMSILLGVCDHGKVSPVDHKREWVTLTLSEFERFAAAIHESAYAKGAEDMRESMARRGGNDPT